MEFAATSSLKTPPPTEGEAGVGGRRDQRQKIGRVFDPPAIQPARRRRSALFQMNHQPEHLVIAHHP